MLEISSFYTCVPKTTIIWCYSSWDTEWDMQNFLSFWSSFCPFSPLKTQKIKILKLKKTTQDIIILHICTIKNNHMMYGSWDMERNKTFCHSRPFFALLPPYGPRKSKLWKNEQHIWRYYHFTIAQHKWQSHDVWFLR